MSYRVKTFLSLVPAVSLIFGCATSAELEREADPDLTKKTDAGASKSEIEAGSWQAETEDAASVVDVLDEDAFEAEPGDSSVAASCDPRFSFSTSTPTEGNAFVAEFTDTPGYVYVDLGLTGPGQPVASWNGVIGDGPFTWSYLVEGHAAGTLDLVFFKNKQPGTNGKKVATCSLTVVP